MQPERNEPPQDEIDESAERERAQREVDENAVVTDDAAGDSPNVSHP